jgi:GT2 family glycosyltransferase
VSFGPGDLSVVIPTRRRWQTLQLTLDALGAQTVSGFEVVVVADGTDQEVPADLPGASRLIQQQHAGPGAARNRGVAEISRPLVLFLGDDMVPQHQLVERHVARHADEPSHEVAVLGRIVWHRDVPRDRLHHWLDWSAALFDYRLLERQADQDAGWGRFYSSNVSMKRELFTATDGFDTDFKFDYEDLDFAYRLYERGMRLLYEREAIAEHLHVYDWDAVVRRYESRAAAEQLMMSKHAWFRPWFRDKIARAESEPRPSRLWPLVVDRLPPWPRRLSRGAEKRANRWYLQRLAPAFNDAWERER